jgi:hypothetical protein
MMMMMMMMMMTRLQDTQLRHYNPFVLKYKPNLLNI